MIILLLFTLFAALCSAQCQTVTETNVECTTSYDSTALSSGVAMRTGYYTTTYSYNTSITSTTQQTITVTPSSTVFTDVVNVTSTITTTVTSVPAATTIAAPAGFFPLINTGIAVAPTANATAIGRHRRGSIETREQHLERLKRALNPKTPDGNTVGFIVLPNGHGQSLVNEFPVYVECQVAVNINITTTTVVTGLPATETAAPATATAVSTSTVLTTETIIETAAQPTEFAACQANNIVNNVIGFNNAPIYFDRIVFANPLGLPLSNSLVVNTTSPTNCCIACQLTSHCAGSFYVPSYGTCHLQLTQAAPGSSTPALPSTSALPPFPLPSSNTSLPYPTASGAPYPAGNGTAVLPTGTALLGTGLSTLIPIATPISAHEDGSMSTSPVIETPTPGSIQQPGAGTCSRGSLSMYLGRVYGQSSFPRDVALYVSNGPCGRMSVGFEEAAPVRQEDLTPLMQRRWIGSSLL